MVPGGGASARPTSGSSRMTYIGSLIIPFAACSWVIRMQAVEGPPTGAREVVWL
jgi:hypothetical protein